MSERWQQPDTARTNRLYGDAWGLGRQLAPAAIVGATEPERPTGISHEPIDPDTVPTGERERRVRRPGDEHTYF